MSDRERRVIRRVSRRRLDGPHTPASIPRPSLSRDDHVQADAADGYILVPHLTPHGLDGFVDQVVPLLQERGTFRTDYTGPTLRDHLGLDRPPSPHRVSP